jgi:hypothetical protein
MKFSLKNVNSSSVLTHHNESVITISGVIGQKICFMGFHYAEVFGEEIVQKKYNMQIFRTIIALKVGRLQILLY